MIAQNMLEEVLQQATQHIGGTDEALLGHLRGSYPGVHFTVCSDNDIPPRLTAAAGNSSCQLYYVASGGHCLALTTDAEAASGLVVARCDDEE